MPEMAALVARCELLISAGAAHLAAAVGTTVVGLYGATAWFAETAPYGDHYVILQTPLNAPMSTISLDSVLAAALNRLNRVSATDLQRKLCNQNQSAWETSVQSPSPCGDPLGGLVYRPCIAIHSRPTSSSPDPSAKHSAQNSLLRPKPVRSRIPIIARLIHWLRFSSTCKRYRCSAPNRREVELPHPNLLLRRALSSQRWKIFARWSPGRPGAASVQSSTTSTGDSACSRSNRRSKRSVPMRTPYISAARILRRAARSEAKGCKDSSIENESMVWRGSFTTEGREGGQVPRSVRIQAPARQRGSVSP
jgi:hypothetical protein